ncbi:inositol monophosphatase family protein [Shouchella clausii]|uniref:inositol monophosphatase family protein n=1 Tax=Shouchella clausii TaxID=79880 RepID=UPI001B2C3F87|nr:inositol monophosphatase family protein [Shouchella clausii]MDO7283814.1 inositol monophosphatase family protein [Shouchella clausii]MDO7303910.1 inositol monophosphatase family protein [Shouchella clausii]MED4158723.1 inositol monophosphatase family protein [Shouchella clausii]MED4176480.1 inositol monophosphatase family protein [Shouchella clausii]GIN05892.1 inositol-1-monophosphatase [Shouchella clausii]
MDEYKAVIERSLKEAKQLIDREMKQIVIETKAHANDLVTNIDRLVESYFIKQIQTHFPNDHIIGEEGIADPIEDLSGTVWIIDPIDGTMNFVHQQKHYAISLGVLVEGVPVLGYVYDVQANDLYSAEAGKGAFLNGERLEKRSTVSLGDALIALDHSFFNLQHSMNWIRDHVRGIRMIGAGSIELAYVAAGKLDAFATANIHPWDYAGAFVICSEAGVMMSQLSGKQLDFWNSSSLWCGNVEGKEKLLEEST